MPRRKKLWHMNIPWGDASWGKWSGGPYSAREWAAQFLRRIHSDRMWETHVLVRGRSWYYVNRALYPNAYNLLLLTDEDPNQGD